MRPRHAAIFFAKVARVIAKVVRFLASRKKGVKIPCRGLVGKKGFKMPEVNRQKGGLNFMPGVSRQKGERRSHGKGFFSRFLKVFCFALCFGF